VSPIDRAPLTLPDFVPLVPPADFASRAAAIGAALSPEAIAKIGDYLGRLLAMNEQMNLTAIKDADGAWERHALDALTLLGPLAEVPAGGRLVDIGSGGGIPGVILAIARPDLDVTLVEATQKKAAFLAAVATGMSLSNVTVLAERAEDLARARDDLRGTFDVVTARAVAKLEALVPLVLPFARAGGLLLLVKGQRADEELAEAKRALTRHRGRHEGTLDTPTGRIVKLRRDG